MKTISLTVLILAAMLGWARAETMDLTTIGGRVYRQCRIIQVDYDGVTFRHANGAGKILFKEMTKDLRDRFDYDPAKAQAHEEKLKSDRAKARAEAQERAKETMKAYQESVNRALETQALAAMVKSMRQPYADYGFISGGLYSDVGPVLDSYNYYRGAGYGQGCYSSPLLNAWRDCYGGGYRRGFVGYRPVGPYNYQGYQGLTGTYQRGASSTSAFFAVPGVGPNVSGPSFTPVTRGRVAVQTGGHHHGGGHHGGGHK